MSSTDQKAGNQRRVGLARALSKLGYCSRSHAFALIRAGEVRVNGRTERNPERPTDLLGDHIVIGDHAIQAAEFRYYIVNKPRGLVTTASDEQGRDTVYSLLPPGSPWVSPVGRLDKASEGLLLLTNDSEWAARISDPASHLDKTYHVQISALPSSELLQILRAGIPTDDGILSAKKLSSLHAGNKNAWLEIVLQEGKNRQIRRMLAAVEVEVLRLVRVAIGPLTLGELRKGACRELTPDEKSKLDGALRPGRKLH